MNATLAATPGETLTMGRIFQRGNKWYAEIRGVDGRRHQLGTSCNANEEAKARAFLHEREREIAAILAIAPDGPLTVHRYAVKWLERRITKTVDDDRTRIELHVLPLIGSKLLIDVHPGDARDVVEALKVKMRDGKLAPKTVRTISGVMHSLFKSAMIDRVVATNPWIFERGVLPKKLDKDPTWRAQAIYSRGEIETLLSSPKVPPDRRVLYALKFFAGRHSEVASLTWAQYDADARPLGALHLGKTKSGVPRAIPVHRALAKVLAAWKLAGFEEHTGEKPKLTDLICPTSSGTQRRADDSQHELVYDLGQLELRTQAGERRHRRGHDLRRTLITLARSDGAIDSILRLITHGPRPNEMLDVYSTPPWEVLCAEISKLRIDLREGAVVKMEAR
jgi:integrase